MTEHGRGGAPQPGAPWGPDPAYPPRPEQAHGAQGPEPTGYPEYPGPPGYPGAPGQQAAAPGLPAYGYPQPGEPGGPAWEASGHAAPGYGYPPAGPGHVVGPGYEGPGDPHGYGYPPLPEAVTQYIPPVPAGPGGAGEDATQYIPPVPAGPGGAGEDATQYIPPVPAGPGPEEPATQYLPPVPAGPAAGFDGLFRGEDAAGQTRHLPPVQEPVLRQQPPRPYPPRAQGPVAQQPYPHPQQGHPRSHPRQQFAPVPPPPPAPRRVSPGIIAAVVIGLAVVGLGVGSLLGDGKPQNNDPGAAPVAPTGASAAAGGGEAPVDPGGPQAVQLDKLLADSNDSRAAVIKAVEDIKTCSNLDRAASDLRDAARQREELVTRLGELKVDQLPDNAKLNAALTKAWQSSAAADNSYAAWAQDVTGPDGCKDGKARSTDNAAAGNRASGDATKAKEQAATLWNTIAAKYSLTKRDKSQL
ncbi:hypothetical protein AB0P12_05010 [Streptomyces subrutilus]|uniref:hypothetical protein n=1 Tax=Streptomyces subrutilus TaxID=36818 RepID=UPI0033F9DA87